MTDSIFLQAFEGKNKKIPVWFMRQAGRYLPQYRRLREKNSLEEMFFNPELAAEITCQPIDILGVDAAILFADILTLPAAMGFDIKFTNGQGPVIQNPVAGPKAIKALHDFTDLKSVEETIKLVNQKLPSHIPLIGFAGAPFTVATYLIEGGSTVNFTKTYQFAYHHPQAFQELLDLLTQNTIAYLKLQKQAGIKAFQLFDTWSGILRPTEYAHWSLPYVQKIFDAVDLPSIYYLKNSAALMRLMDQCHADFLSVCHSVVLGHEPILEKNHHGVQGNFFNGLLYADKDIIKKEIEDVLAGAKHYTRYIFNLNHGIFPDVEVDKLKSIVEQVHAAR